MNIDITRLLLLILAGAIAGFVIFLVFNPGIAQEENSDHHFTFTDDIMAELSSQIIKNFIDMMVVTAAFSMMLGGMLILFDELRSAFFNTSGFTVKRIAVRMGAVVGASAIVGAVAGFISQFAFMGINIITLGFGGVIARVVGWMLMGAGSAICLGYVLGGWKRAKMSVIGGLLGGLIGGLLFDALAVLTSRMSNGHDASLSRLIGFMVIGMATGAAVAIVEDVIKQSWVTVLNGPKEGRSFIITKPVTTLGKDEMADIPLFGDPAVSRQHARLVLDDKGGVIVEAVSGSAVTINGAQMPRAMLRPWDTIGVGRFSLRFHQKAGQHQYMPIPQQWQSPMMPQPQYSPVNRTVAQPAARIITGRLTLVAVAGPHINQRFQFDRGTVTIGRESDCAVLLAQDTVVSRKHAEISWDGSKWIIRDLGSRNGLWINGSRVTEHALNIGDQVGVGQTWLRAESV